MTAEHSADRLRLAAVAARRAIAAAVAEGVHPPDGVWLDIWHLIAEAEHVSAELAPGRAAPPPRLFAAEDAAYGMTVPSGVTVQLGDGRLARYRFDRTVRDPPG